MAIVDKRRSKTPLGRFAKDLTGKHFGRLKVLKWAGRDRKGDLLWECLCKCGRRAVVLGRSLSHGMSKSCGCLSRDTAMEFGHKHGLSRTRIYRVWISMIRRCHHPGTDGYENYGGRGIRVCDRWRTSVAAFASDMGPEPFSGCTVERKNNNKGYCKSNCRWASRKEQAANKRTSIRRVRYKRKMYSVLELSEAFGVRYHVIYNRLRSGWSVHDAITKTVKSFSD